MKKYFPLIVLFLLSFNTSWSQTEQGKFVVSGATNLQFLFSNSDPSSTEGMGIPVKEENFGVNAGFGYFMIDNLVINITGSYDYTYRKKNDYQGYPNEQSIENTLSIIPSLTYFIPVEGNLRPTISFGVGYVDLKEKSNQSSAPENIVYHYGGTSVNAGAGLSYFLIKSVSLDLGFQYSHNNLTDKTDKRRSQLQKNYGVRAGLSFYF